MPHTVRWDRVFLAVGVPFGLALLVLLPPGVSIDAPAHLVRIDQIAHGGLVSPLDPRGQAIATPDEAVMSRYIYMSVWLGMKPVLARQFKPTSRRFPSRVDVSNMALNSPVSYVPEVVGYGVGRALGGLVWGIWLAKLAGLACYLALCWLAIRVAPRARAVLALVALLPTSLTQAATLSADSVPISLALLSMALLLRLREPRDSKAQVGLSAAAEPDTTRRLLWALGVCLVALALSKNLYAVVALVVFLVPATRFASRRGRRLFQVGVLGSIVVGCGSWIVLVVNKVMLHYMPGANLTSFTQRDWIAHHPLGFARIAARSVFATNTILGHTIPSVVATWGGLGFRPLGAAPVWVTLGTVALLVGAVRLDPLGFAGGPAAVRTDVVLRIAIAAVMLVVVMALVLYGETLAMTPKLESYPDITYIQGRYFTPILPFLVLLPFSIGASVPMATSGSGDALPGVSRWRPLLVPAGIVALEVWFLYTIVMMYR